MDYIAHKRNETDGKEEKIINHLTETATMAKIFAEPFNYGAEAYFIGMLHDIGKYGKSFQRRIRNENIRVNHSTAGAVTSLRTFNFITGAFCIAGHHGGIPNIGSRADTAFSGTMWGKLNDKNIDDYSYWEKEQKNIEEYKISNENINYESPFGAAFLIHMLFSCLVDADYICTERFMNENTVNRGGYDDIPTLLNRLNDYISKWGKPTSELNKLRSEIQRQCISAKDCNENLLSLTVPTGGGKTISSLAFALNYAVQKNHIRKRIIYVAPYTSIIEQNAGVFRDVLGAENVVEHHSNVSFDRNNMSDEEVTKQQLACENWDAPIIVTTAVQFFESLFSNKPSKSRKLHNLAESVIIFDEAQMIPVDYLTPCISAINELTERYNTTAVLCTATQPNLDKFFGQCRKKDSFKIPEICSIDQERYVEEFRRAEFEYDGKLSDDELVLKISGEKQVLCIVNTKAHAEKLFKMLGDAEENICLSTHKYPKQRKCEIKKLKDRLAKGLPCRVISTSLIEAGVDIDFKTVYRAITGLDSILQAGGRCNRENRNSRQDSIVHIFDTDVITPYQEKNTSIARKVIRKYGNEIYKTEAIKMYFDELYYIINGSNGEYGFDKNSIIKDYNSFNFQTVADNFKMIDKNTKTIYIETDDSRPLIDNLRNKKYSRSLFRNLEQYGVNLFEYEFQKLDNASAIETVDNDFFVLSDNKYYNPKTGIEIPDADLGMALFT